MASESSLCSRCRGFPLFPRRSWLGSILTRQKQSGDRPIGFGDDPYFFSGVCAIAAQKPEPALQAELVFAVIFFGHSPRTWRDKNSAGDCLAFSSAANAPGVATIWPRENSGCCLVCRMGTPEEGLDFCRDGPPKSGAFRVNCPSWSAQGD